MTSILGVDIGGTKTAVLRGDGRAQISHRVEFSTRPERGFDPVFDELCCGAESVLAESKADGGPCDRISVSIGGPLDVEAGIVNSPPNLPGWDAIPLKRLLAERFGLPVYIEHDGNAGALAEWMFGAAQGARNVVFLTMGTGFGGGLILDGRLYRGTTCLAGEVGHVRLADTGPTSFGKQGSWEAFCSGTGIARLASLRFPKRWGECIIFAKELSRLAEEGDADALAVFDEAGRYLGAGLAMLLDVLNPEVIVIGSLAVRLGDLVLGPAREVMAEEALPGAVAACRLVPAALGERLGDVASLCAALRAE